MAHISSLRIPKQTKGLWPFAIVVVCLLIPQLASQYWLYLVEILLIYTIVVAGLNLVMGYAGQVSLGHAAIYAVGAYTSALLTVSLGLPFWFACISAIVVACLAGLLLGIPSLRLEAMYLAMATLAFNIIVENVLVTWDSFTGGYGGINYIPAPSVGAFVFNKTSYFYLLLFTVVLEFWLMRNFLESRHGRALVAIREDTLAANCVGISVFRYKLIAFVISAGLAGLAGCFYAHLMEFISPKVSTMWFSFFLCLSLIIGGQGTMTGPIIGAVLLTLLPEYMHGLESFRLTVYGSLLVLAPTFMPRGLGGSISSLGSRLWPGNKELVVTDIKNRSSGRNISVPFSRRELESGVLLKTKELTISFGGLAAVNRLNLQIQEGSIHGLIGPNGSGKTTVLNLITGVYKPTSGSIRLGQVDITFLPPHRIACLGIARTFQNTRIFQHLSVLENIMVGQHYWRKSTILSSSLAIPSARKEEREMREFALSLCRFIGLEDKAHELVKDLAHVKQRRIEIARALALKPNLLLLDEPASGLSELEMTELNEMILKIREWGITVLVIEHHMDVVMNISDKVTVLNFGVVIAEGKPPDIQNNRKVIEAYLGD